MIYTNMMAFVAVSSLGSNCLTCAVRFEDSFFSILSISRAGSAGSPLLISGEQCPICYVGSLLLPMYVLRESFHNFLSRKKNFQDVSPEEQPNCQPHCYLYILYIQLNFHAKQYFITVIITCLTLCIIQKELIVGVF